MKLYYNKEYENEVLGNYMINGELIYESKLRPHHFYNNQNKLMFNAMLDIKAKDEKIDAFTVYREVSKKKSSKWTITDITQLITSSISLSSVEGIEREIISLYEKRNFLDLTNKAISRMESEDFQTIKADLINNLESNISDDIPILSMGECAYKAIEKLEEAYKNGGRITGMESGYKLLDGVINGFEKSCYMVIGARPGVGKTALSLELATRLSQKNNIIFFSLEMPFDQLGQRVLSSNGQVPLKNIKTGRVKDTTFNALLQVANRLIRNNKCKVIEKENLKVEDLVNICKVYKRKNGLDGIIIDYFTLLKSYKTFRDARLSYNYISEELRMLSKKLNINIILLAQCNRGADTKRELQLSDLKETANLEQDANIVMFLEGMDDQNPRKDGEPREDYLRAVIRKNRAGENNMEIKFRYYKSTQILDEVECCRIIKKSE